MTFEDFISEWRSCENFITANTSGSTGAPKTIRLSKKFVEDSARRTNSFFKIKEGSNFHSCVSPDFIGGKMMAVRAEISNGSLSWEIPSNEPLKNLDSSLEIHLLAVVPSQMLYILENLGKIPHIHNIIIGGAPIHPDLRKRIASSGLKAFETYGMTETASHIALRKITSEETPFFPLPGIHVGLDNQNCLKISFDSGEEIHTNDLAEIYQDNSFMIKGRKDQIIISGGKKINPVLVEEKISPYIPYAFCITSFPDEKWGERIVLLLEGELDSKFVSSLREKINSVLNPWEKPKEIIYTKKLPRTPNGKILRVKNPSSLSFSAPCKNLVSGVQNKQG